MDTNSSSESREHTGDHGVASLGDILEVFPSIPSEIAETWLLHYAQTRGWPPLVPGGQDFAPNWRALFLNLRPELWQSLEWSTQEVRLSSLALCRRDVKTISLLVDSYTTGCLNSITEKIPDGRERFESLLSYIKTHRQLPARPVLIQLQNEIQIVDGCHRIAAWARSLRADLSSRPSLFANPEPSFVAWVGRQ